MTKIFQNIRCYSSDHATFIWQLLILKLNVFLFFFTVQGITHFIQVDRDPTNAPTTPAMYIMTTQLSFPGEKLAVCAFK